MDEASISPVRAPKTLRATRRSVRPTTALARLPGPSALWRVAIWRSAVTGPLTSRQNAAPPVLVITVWALNAGSSMAHRAATASGKCSGAQPAITALEAVCWTLSDRPRSSMLPRTASVASPA